MHYFKALTFNKCFCFTRWQEALASIESLGWLCWRRSLSWTLLLTLKCKTNPTSAPNHAVLQTDSPLLPFDPEHKTSRRNWTLLSSLQFFFTVHVMRPSVALWLLLPMIGLVAAHTFFFFKWTTGVTVNFDLYYIINNLMIISKFQIFTHQ